MGAEALAYMGIAPKMMRSGRVFSAPMRRTCTRLCRLLLLCVLCFLGEVLSMALWSTGNSTYMILLGPATMFCCLALTPRTLASAGAVFCFAGIGLAFFFSLDIPVFVAMLKACGIALPIYVVTRLLHVPEQVQAPRNMMPAALRFIMLGGIALPLLHVFWQWQVARATSTMRPDLSWMNVGFAYSSGYLLLVPAVLSALKHPRGKGFPSGARLYSLLLPLAIIGVLAILWSNREDSFFIQLFSIMAVFPLLIWTLVLLGISGACGTMLAISLLGMTMTLRGAGPFAGLPIDSATLSMQTWTSLTGIAILICSVLVDEKRGSYALLEDAYQQLSNLTGKVIIVREEERTRIARDLHDNVNQSLAAISINLSTIRRSVDEQGSSSLLSVQQDLQRVSDDIRDISHELHPSILRFTGLASALRNFCRKHSDTHELDITCNICEPLSLSTDQELALFRIVQESVQNIEKHAKARSVTVSLHCNECICELLIEDDGIGLPHVGVGKASQGLGVISMMERARILGGHLSIATSTSGGTLVKVWFPLSK